MWVLECYLTYNVYSFCRLLRIIQFNASRVKFIRAVSKFAKLLQISRYITIDKLRIFYLNYVLKNKMIWKHIPWNDCKNDSKRSNTNSDCSSRHKRDQKRSLFLIWKRKTFIAITAKHWLANFEIQICNVYDSRFWVRKHKASMSIVFFKLGMVVKVR